MRMKKTVWVPQETENTNDGRNTTASQLQEPGISGRSAGLTGAKPRPTPGVPTHRATMATPVLTDDETRVYRSCVGEVRILASYLRAATTGAVEALRRSAGNARCLQQAESPGRGSSFGEIGRDPASRKSQSSGHEDADGSPMALLSRRQSCVATSSGMAEDHAMCSTAEGLLHLRSVLEHFEFKMTTTPRCDCVEPRGSKVLHWEKSRNWR